MRPLWTEWTQYILAFLFIIDFGLQLYLFESMYVKYF